MKFYLGTHRPQWLRFADFPLFISKRLFDKLKTFPKSSVEWALDSGGFTELSMYGKWMTSEAQYVDEVSHIRDSVGMMNWCAPMDWMCEPRMLAKTGLSIREHQDRTIENYLRLKPQLPEVIPVLQGWDVDDYLECIDRYHDAGVYLDEQRIVGLGSVCRRQASQEIMELVKAVSDTGLNLHGFGIKQGGLMKYGHLLGSADSLAWSFAARWEPPKSGCRLPHCTNCYHWASDWRDKVLASL